MLVRHRGSQRGHRVPDTCRGQGDNVHVSLHDERAARATHGVSVPVEPVEDLPLVVDRRFGRVEVLRPSLSTPVQHAAPEADDPSRERLDRKDEPPPEAVVGLRRALRRGRKADLQQQVLREAVLGRRLSERVPFIGSPSQAEALGRLCIDSPALHIGPSAPTRPRIQELLAKPAPSERVRLVMRLKGVVSISAASSHLVDLDAKALPEGLHRILEVHASPLHHEREDVARLPTSKTLVKALVGHHVERRRPVVVERTLPLPILARPLERHALADDAYEIGSRPDFLHEIVGDHFALRV